MIISLHTDLKFSGFVCVDTYLKTLIRMVTFLIFCLFRERPGVNFDIVAIMNSNTPILVPQYSRYFKNPWGLKLFLKCHRRSQNVYFFLLGTNHFIKHSGVFFRSSRPEVLCEKRHSWQFHKIHRKTPEPEPLF